MINLKDKINSRNDLLLNEVLESYWNGLNKKTAKGDYYRNSLISKCEKVLIKIKTKKYLKDVADNCNETRNRHKGLIEFFMESNHKNLSRLIKGNPNELSVIKNEILKIIKEDDVCSLIKGQYTQTEFGKILSEDIFSYKSFRSSKLCRDILVRLGFTSVSCPYCNLNKLSVINITNTTSTSQKNKALLDLDHFYPKVIHPYFSLSFYNLIPSCHDCNSSIKKEKKFSIETHINPYHESFDDIYKFELSLDSLHNKKAEKVELKKITKLNDSTANDLLLLDRYNNNISEVEGLVDFFYKNQHSLQGENKEYFIDLLSNVSNVLFDKMDINKFCYSKIKRDLLRQLDIHNLLDIK
ncbi:hypothetical protein [Aliamphritea hakodatensis]|uniref:hypothetical protein n=1 Tax=Aliamphritea hakodatensis TaxID=2895352 RepID=UPI0022FD3BC3|nr:hypothetical protein [Aliamphritea hakodatensis]